MANKGGYTRLKRQMAPKFWKIERKHSRFVLKVHPGPHSKSTCLSIRSSIERYSEGLQHDARS